MKSLDDSTRKKISAEKANPGSAAMNADASTARPTSVEEGEGGRVVLWVRD